jgi:hypothetical protein
MTTGIVVCVEPHAGRLADGTEYVAGFGERYKRGDEIVQKSPMYFVPDGERLVPPEREFPDEPAPPPRPKRKMLRATKDWTSDERLMPGAYARFDRKVRVTLHKGKLTDPSAPWLAVLTARERAKLFDEVEAP